MHDGRDEEIRTLDLLDPNQAHYQAVLRLYHSLKYFKLTDLKVK